MAASDLPVGFTLDQPAAASGLPPGFTLDAPAPKRKAFSFGGDSNLLAADAFGALNDFIDRKAYQAGGAVTDQAAKVLPPEAAAAAGYVTNVGLQAAPALFGGEAAKLAAPLLRKAAEHVMQSALKPTASSLMSGFRGAPSKADRAIGTMLDEGINVSEGGVAKLQQKVADQKGAINDAVAASTATVDKSAVASRLQDVTKRFENQPLPDADLKTIEDAYAAFMKGPLPSQIPVAQAQAIKEGGGTLLKKKYGSLGAADVEVEKALVRGFKEEIASAVPGIDKLNARESNLLNALLLADRRAGIAGNKDIGGLAFLAHNPKAAAALALDRSSVFKSVLARLINANQRTLPGAAAGGGIAAYEANGSQN